MRIKIISCWFATSYGSYTDGLRQGLERKLGNEVGIIASNCGCGDPIEIQRQFQDKRCDFFEFPNIDYFKSPNPTKYWLRNQARNLLYYERVKQYQKRAGDAEVIHFQQILNATGSVPLFNWLKMPSNAARVVTVHELDPYQVDFPKSNLTYNKADRIIVHTEAMKEKLISLGVTHERIDVVLHGVDIRPMPDGMREGIIFYGGHTLNKGKGLDTLLKAMALVKKQLVSAAPVLTIHGHYGMDTPTESLQAASEAGVASSIRWLNQINHEAVTLEYQKALLCVLPYTGSFAGYPAAIAMANGVPVIGTRRAGLPDHLGDTGVWIKENDPEELANTIVALLRNEEQRRDIITRARARAEKLLSWDVIAQKTLASYEKAVRTKTQS
jgi:glycosyltransferase involved in cell wall biosynthesis